MPKPTQAKDQSDAPNGAVTAVTPPTEPLLPPQYSTSPTFIDFAELSRHVPLCERSLRQAIRDGRIPSIRLKGARRLLFHWGSVQEALLRLQRGLE